MERRQVYLFCGCIFPLLACSGVVYSMFSLYLAEVLNAGKSQIGLIFMCGSLAGFLSASLVGELADKWGRKKVILTSIGLFSLVFLLYSLIRDYRLIYAVEVLEGIAWVSMGAAANAYLADLALPERRGWAMGTYQKTLSLAWVVGPAIGGVLFETLGFQTTFLIGAVVTCLSAIPTLFLVRETREKRSSSAAHRTTSPAFAPSSR